MVVCSNALNQFVILCRFFKVSSVKIVVLIRLDFHCSLSGFLRDLSTSASCCRWGSTTSELLQMRLWSFSSDSPQVQWVFFLRTVEVQIPVVICWKWKEQTYKPKVLVEGPTAGTSRCKHHVSFVCRLVADFTWLLCHLVFMFVSVSATQ